jgi:anti-sigma B factor antagonist
MDYELSVCGHDRCVVVGICGECDASNAATLRDHLLGVLTRVSPWMVADLSRLEFLDCAGARVLVSTRRRAMLLGGALALAAPTAPTTRLLQLTGLSLRLAIFPTVDAALAAIRPGDHPVSVAAGPGRGGSTAGLLAPDRSGLG